MRKDLIEQVESQLPEWAGLNRSLFAGLRGSDAHGTKLEEDEANNIDDIDVFNVVVLPLDHYLGLESDKKRYQHWDSAGEDVDILVYDVKKFFRLLVNSNPNVINWLWNKPEHYLVLSDWGKVLIEHREKFLSKGIFSSLVGYAMGQKHKMTSFQKYEGYMGEKRKRLVDEFGYDVKNAAHCVRLILTAIDIAEQGTFSTYLDKDRAELIKSIKRGEKSLGEVSDLIDDLYCRFQSSESKCDLRDEVDIEEANKLLISILR